MTGMNSNCQIREICNQCRCFPTPYNPFFTSLQSRCSPTRLPHVNDFHTCKPNGTMKSERAVSFLRIVAWHANVVCLDASLINFSSHWSVGPRKNTFNWTMHLLKPALCTCLFTIQLCHDFAITSSCKSFEINFLTISSYYPAVVNRKYKYIDTPVIRVLKIKYVRTDAGLVFPSTKLKWFDKTTTGTLMTIQARYHSEKHQNLLSNAFRQNWFSSMFQISFFTRDKSILPTVFVNQTPRNKV